MLITKPSALVSDSPERIIAAALLPVEAVVVGVGQLDVRGVPPVAGGGAARVERLDGGVVPHRVDVDRPRVAVRRLLVRLAGVLQPNHHRRVRPAAVPKG